MERHGPAWQDPIRCWVYREAAGLLVPGGASEGPEPAPGGRPGFPRTRRVARELVRAVRRTSPLDLEVERVRLFVNGPRGVAAPPYASLYVDGEMLGPSARWVQSRYAACGLDAVAGEPPDFVPTELEFLHLLCRHVEDALRSGDAASLAASLDVQAGFFVDHVRLWIPGFTARLRGARPRAPFARLADLLDAFRHEEEAALAPTRTG